MTLLYSNTKMNKSKYDATFSLSLEQSSKATTKGAKWNLKCIMDVAYFASGSTLEMSGEH